MDGHFMKQVHDLSALDWTVEGYTPFLWLFERRHGGMGSSKCVDVRPVPARVPGSVQGALREAGILPDWNIGVNSRQCEWVEHRHWMYRTNIPDAWLAKRCSFRLECMGLDYSGWIIVNGNQAGAFKGTHIPHVFDITGFLKDTGNVLEIVFDLPPQWLGQFGYTSQMTEWKTRFNYTWDWTPRLVQIGIWDSISLAVVDGSEFRNMKCVADFVTKSCAGVLEVRGGLVAGDAVAVDVSLERDGTVVRHDEVAATAFRNGIRWNGLSVKPWWPNLEGDQPLYTVTCRLVDKRGREHDRAVRRVGFRHVEWSPCKGAPNGADPWVCVVNGRPVFMQGVNFPPLASNYADLRREDYERRLRQYHDLGCNIFRINACQFLEREWFYDLCDELGLMVWQEFPLTSSGLENWPPEDRKSISAVEAIARSYVERRGYHASLVLWSGANEVMGDMKGKKSGMGKPCGMQHPMLKRLGKVVREMDPGRRYIPTSPSGPRAGANPADFGKGLHWDVHGGAAMGSMKDARKYWASDDALLRSEIYCSGASPVDLIRKYAGKFKVFPATPDNPYWTRLTTWWIDWQKLIAIHGRAPRNLAEYVKRSQANQAKMVSGEMAACKRRFPACGGVLMWSGHDTFPLTINTSLIDFDGNPKPAARAVARVWRKTTVKRKKKGKTAPLS